MYLSRLFLNPASSEMRRDLADCQEMHRTIMSAFPLASVPQVNAREHFGILHRLEVDQRRGKVTLYIQSREKPDWSCLPPDYLMDMPGEENPALKSIIQQYSSLQPGTILYFRLRANPTRKIDTKTGPDGQRRHGKRVELRQEEDQINWLRRKGEQGGFELLHVQVNPVVPDVRAIPEKNMGGIFGQRRSGRTVQRQRLTFASVLFEGHLRIIDPIMFLTKSLCKGLGPGKAYGMGLLSIAPPVR